MDVDSVPIEESQNIHKNGQGDDRQAEKQVNGVSNGHSGESKHHKSSHKDKHRDKDRDRKDHKSSNRDKDRDKDRHGSTKDKDRSKDHKSSHRDKDKDRSDKDKHRSDKDKDRSDKDKDRSDKDKDRKSSSSKDHKSSHSSRDKDKDKEHKSSSSHDKDRHKSSSSKDADKDKDRHKSSKDKDRTKSSSSSNKHHSSSSRDKEKDRSDRKDKHRDEKRDKHRSDKDKSRSHENGDREKHRESKHGKEMEIEMIKPEPVFKTEAEIDRENDINHSTASSCDYSMSQFNKSEIKFAEGDSQNGNESVGEEQEADNSQDDEDYENNEITVDEIKLEVKVEQDPLAEESDEEDIPLAARVPMKRQHEPDEDDDDDDVPLAARKKVKVKKEKKAKKRVISEDEEEYDEKPKKAKVKKGSKVQVKQEIKQEGSPKKKKKKGEEQEPEVWKWWEEEKKDDGKKWHFLEHKGPVFAPEYERLPENVKFYYDGKEIRLSQDAEEVAGFYARMLEHDYTSKDVFNNNFMKDWRKCMTDKERSVITKLEKCNFRPMNAYFLDLSEKNRNRSKEEKEETKKKNAELIEEFGFCLIDGHREKIGNFRIEPPGLFRGRGEHPKMGMLKKRVVPEDISINCSKDSKIPKAPPGHKWKDVRHDPQVTWLCSWTENVQNQVKYIMLNPSSKLKGEKDWQKYETARRLAKTVDKIRAEYREDWKSKEMRIRQRAVALYFIDKLALRAGNEKDEDQADTVGCCSLRVEHIQLEEHKDGKDYVVIFDFLGKDSIRYYNEVPVEKRVFKNLQLFMENKSGSDDLFDRLNTAVMNKHLSELMEGLTAKVFRTFNASWTLQQQLDELTNEDDSVAEKILSYNRANRAVAVLCNHQRSVPKGHEKSMEKLKEKIDQKRDQIADGEKQVKEAKRSSKGGSVKGQVLYNQKKKQLERLKEQLKKLELQETDRDENKSIALGTSKLNYLDPRISIAWCKKHDVPIEKIYNKTQRDKFRWAVDMATADYVF